MKRIIFGLSIALFLVVAGYGVNYATTSAKVDNTEIEKKGDKEKKGKKGKKGKKEGCCAGKEEMKKECGPKEGAGCCGSKKES